MLKIKVFLLLNLGVFLACNSEKPQERAVASPGENLRVEFFLAADGQPGYLVNKNGNPIIDTSLMSFDLRDAPALRRGFEVVNTETSSFSETWEMPWGEVREVENNYNELRVELQETAELNRKLNIVFRVYDDGLGFRYEFPEQPNLTEVVIMDENTEFNLTGDHMACWQPGDWDIYEHHYHNTRFSEIDALQYQNHSNLAQTYIPENAVNTPVTMTTDDGVYLSFHEASLYDYSGMTLKVDKDNLKWVSELVGGPEDIKVTRTAPFHTPWRTIQVADRAGDLIESHLIVNLNEPNKLEDVSWIKPMKYVGIWWEYHIGKNTWKMEGGKHGATTEHAKELIDFAAANDIGGLLVEGWNTGWERWIGFEDREGVFDFVTPYPDYDIREVVNYGKGKGVEIIMHHETSSATGTYDKQLDTAFALCQELGIHAVKTGYVGKIIPRGHYHHGQYMVNHYQRVLETATKYKVAVNAHEPIKDTGIRRTWPSFIAREGLRGQEFNAFSIEGGNNRDHLPNVVFTRMLSGPIDYTPGIFDLEIDDRYKPTNRVKHTLAQELALYVVIYSPIQMAADLIENYKDQPAFQFVRDVAVDWETTKVLNGEVGDYVTIVRKERDGDRWFLGSITDESAREFDIALDFLDSGKTYKAIIYADTPNSHWEENPTAIGISEMEVTSDQTIKLNLVESGGAAISFEPIGQ